MIGPTIETALSDTIGTLASRRAHLGLESLYKSLNSGLGEWV